MNQANTANVDQDELNKFDEIASHWWDRDSEFKPLHDINPLRVGFIDRIAHLSGKKVLDVGCGGGILAESMARRGADVTGIDMAAASLKIAKLHALESQLPVKYRHMPVEELAEECPGSFDVVTCLEMLEHVPDPASIIKACTKLAKPGGKLFFSTLNRNPKSYLFAIVGAEQVLKLVPRGTHEFKRFIRPAELAQWLRENQLQLEEVTGLTYNPLTKHYRLDPKDIDVNYMVSANKPGAQ